PPRAPKRERSGPVTAGGRGWGWVVALRSPALFLEVLEAGQQPPLPFPHRLGFLILGMVVFQQMQYPVHDEQPPLVVERPAAAVGLPLRHLRAHDDVADDRPGVSRLRR